MGFMKNGNNNKYFGGDSSNNNSRLRPRKLKELASKYLNWEIQKDGESHSPYDDALAAMDLYKLVRSNWEKVMEYKINKTKMIEQQRSKKVMGQQQTQQNAVISRAA